MKTTKPPRIWIRMFKPRFAPMVVDGRKRQTVRPRPTKRRYIPRVGDTIRMCRWAGKAYRSKQIVLSHGTITEVASVGIGLRGSIAIAGRPLNIVQRAAFAQADGFLNHAEMIGWFREEHGLPFRGVLIKWELNHAV